MSRRRYRQINGKLVEISNSSNISSKAPLILTDIEPYQSIITGETITSRSHHREHLKQHGAEETGDNMPKFLKDSYERRGDRPEWGRDGRRIG